MSPTDYEDMDTPEPKDKPMSGIQKLVLLIVFIVVVCGVGLGLLWAYGII